jgi:biopolymer transport protein ExbB
MLNSLYLLAATGDSVTIFDLFYKGGVLMILLFFCSVVAVGVIIERFLKIRQHDLDLEPFLQRMSEHLRQDNMEEALKQCEESPASVAKVCRAGLLRHDRPLKDIEEGMEDAAVSEMPKLEQYLGLLATVAYVAPLLGLLGTVIGMIQAFRTIALNLSPGSQAVAQDLLLNGIWQALVNTAAGLTIAIPVYVAYNYFSSRVNSIAYNMERTGTVISELLRERQNGNGE